MEEGLVFVDLVEFWLRGFAPCAILHDIERSDDDLLRGGVAELPHAVDADVVDLVAGAVFEGVVPLLVSLLVKVADEWLLAGIVARNETSGNAELVKVNDWLRNLVRDAQNREAQRTTVTE